MKKLKIIIVLLILLLIVSIGICVVLTNKNDIISSEPPEEGGSQDELISLATNSTKEENDNIFFTINDTIQLLFEYIEEGNIEAIYNITNIEYIKENNITSENIMQIYTNSQGRKYYYAQEMYKIQDYSNETYYTYGIVIENNEPIDFYLKVKIKDNSNFSIEPLSLEEYNKAKKGEIHEVESCNIESNSNNNYTIKNYFSEETVKRYMQDFKLKLKYMPDEAFNLLDDDYRQKKFDNIEQFKNYIQENATRFNEFMVQEYKKEIQDNYIEYIVIDENNNYYKIIVFSALDYKIILDNDI